jgi:hypothetical protein
VVSSLLAATAGNPLALTEVAQRLTSRQVLGAEPLPPVLPLTASAGHVFTEVLDGIPDAALDALGLFAVADGEETAVALAAAGRLGIASHAIADLESRGLVRLDTGQVRLRHALLATAVRDRLAPGRERLLHGAIADGLDEAAPIGRARRAWHLAEARLVPNETWRRLWQPSLATGS